MPVHIENMTSDVSVFDGDLPMSEAQIDKLTALVMERIEKKHRAQQQNREATRLSRHAAPPSPICE
jgi:hypothetical protein